MQVCETEGYLMVAIKMSVFWNLTLCNKCLLIFRETCFLHLQGEKMEVVHSFITSVNIYQTTWCQVHKTVKFII
jgi:hypothetical protein